MITRLLLLIMLLPVSVMAGGGITEAEYGPDVDTYPHRIMGDIFEKQVLDRKSEIGRASCRVRVYISVVAVSLKKKRFL